MSHAQTRVSTLLYVVFGSAEAKNQKVTQSLFSAGEIVFWVDPPQDIVVRNLTIKRCDQTLKSALANGGIDFVFLHGTVQ